MISSEIVSGLLEREEWACLDFKVKLGFPHGSEHQKEELLKDIMAMSNTVACEFGYIVIGAKKRPHQKLDLIGIDDADKIDNAAITEFVNKKLNRAILFQYETIEIDGNTLGVLVIKPDGAWHFLKEDFGKLRGKTIYYRNNDSTDIMTPDEIAERSIKNNFPRLSLQLFSESENNAFISSETVALRQIEWVGGKMLWSGLALNRS